jgi:nucleoside-diphosphate kinase
MAASVGGRPGVNQALQSCSVLFNQNQAAGCRQCFLLIHSAGKTGLHFSCKCSISRRDPIFSTQSKRRMNLMAVERTFSIIKPDATARNLTGAINAMVEQAGLRIVAQKRVRITRQQAEAFYAVHSARPFFGELVDFMISGPVVVQVLEGENAIGKYRDVMGATDPAKAAAGTIRKVHALSIGENSVHGSDASDTAAKEIAQFFSGNEIVG